LQAFGGFLIPGKVKLKTRSNKDAPIKSEKGFSSGIVLGHDFGRFRLQGEISGRRYNHNQINLDGHTYVINGQTAILGPSWNNTPLTGYSSTIGGLVTAIYDINLTESIDLFLGIGTGVTRAKLKLNNLNGDNVNIAYNDTIFAYQFLTGLAWDFTERASVRFAYKYFSTAESKDFDSFDSHNLELGLQIDL